MLMYVGWYKFDLFCIATAAKPSWCAINSRSISCKRATVDRKTKNDHAPSPQHAAKPFVVSFKSTI